MAYCDFTSRMNMRAVCYLLCFIFCFPSISCCSCALGSDSAKSAGWTGFEGELPFLFSGRKRCTLLSTKKPCWWCRNQTDWPRFCGHFRSRWLLRLCTRSSKLSNTFCFRRVPFLHLFSCNTLSSFEEIGNIGARRSHKKHNEVRDYLWLPIPLIQPFSWENGGSPSSLEESVAGDWLQRASCRQCNSDVLLKNTVWVWALLSISISFALTSTHTSHRVISSSDPYAGQDYIHRTLSKSAYYVRVSFLLSHF